MSFYDAIRVGASGAGDFEIERSAKFRGATDQRFDRTLSSTSSSYTVSFWFKDTPVTTNFTRGLFTLGPANNTEVAGVVINTGDTLTFHGGNGTSAIVTTRKLRDTSAWYYFTYSVNSNNFTAYLNGESLQTGTVRSLDTTSNGFRVGGWWGGYDLFQGYIADFYLIDGLALTPSSFTKTNVETGQLVPKLYTGSFGTSGAHLLFDDNSGTTATTLGKDSSGNGNNFTPVNSWATRDVVPDTPTNNFCTFNPLKAYTNGATFDRGNLRCTHGAGGNGGAPVNFGLQSGKWYAEMLIEYDGNGTQVGISGEKSAFNSFPITDCLMIGASGEVITNGSNSYPSLPVGNTFTAGDIMGMALDITGGTIKWYKNNSLVYTLNLSTMTSGGNSDSVYFFTSGDGSSATAGKHVLNAGQDSTFDGNKTKQGNADENGIGDFYYSPPSGHLAVCSANLPDPTIKLPNKHFDTLLWSGNSTNNRSITGLEFQPDWLWVKARTVSIMSHYLVYSLKEYTDSGSGNGNVGAFISGTNTAEAEGTTTDGGFESFDSNGFTFGKGSNDANADSAYQRMNASGRTYVGWNWNAGDTDSATYTVKVVSDSGNKYRFNDFGTSAVTLDLAEGGTYTFDQSDSSMSSHPMKLSTTANGTHGGGSSYNTGVTYQLDGSSVTESAFVSGFSSASSRKLIITVAASAPTLYYYCHYHSGMGSSINTNSTLGSSNFDGTGQSKVKANTTAGFSIVQYTGNATGSSSSAVWQTIGHGLGVTPQLIIMKARSYSSADTHWTVYHHKVTDANTDYLVLDTTEARVQTDVNYMGSTLPTSSVFSLGYNFTTNKGSENYVAYCFSEVKGYSKFGKYTGNASSNGPFCFTGFRPAWVLLKGESFAGNWNLFDNKRPGINVTNDRLFPNLSDAETDGSSVNNQIDILSNGFKLRGSNVDTNSNNDTYIYLAFAESPFKNSRAR